MVSVRIRGISVFYIRKIISFFSVIIDCYIYFRISFYFSLPSYENKMFCIRAWSRYISYAYIHLSVCTESDEFAYQERIFIRSVSCYIIMCIEVVVDKMIICIKRSKVDMSASVLVKISTCKLMGIAVL